MTTEKEQIERRLADLERMRDLLKLFFAEHLPFPQPKKPQETLH